MLEESLLEPVIAELKPIGCSRLESEFKDLTAILKNSDSDYWDKRDQALRKIACITIHPDVDQEELAKQIRILKTTLATQVEDLRSAIVRTTAVLCVVLHETLGSAFHSVFEFLLPSFVKQLAVKAVPTRESSHECLLRIISGGENREFNERLLKLVFSYVGDKDKVIRTRISLYVQGLCNKWDQEILQRNLKDIIDYLLRAQGDGESKVRAAARETIAELGDTFPGPIAKAVKSLTEPKQQKEILKLMPEAVRGMLFADTLDVGVPITRTISAQPSAPRLSAGPKPTRASTGQPVNPNRRGSAPETSNIRAPRAASVERLPIINNNKGPQISPALERRMSRNGVRMAGLRTTSSAPKVSPTLSTSQLPAARGRSVSDHPQRRPSISAPNSRASSPKPSPTRQGLTSRSRQSMDSTSSINNRLSQQSDAGSRRGSQDSAASTHTTPTPSYRSQSPAITASHNPHISEQLSHFTLSDSNLLVAPVSPPQERRVLTERGRTPTRTPSPYKGRVVRSISSQRPEEKAMMAAKLANTLDLLDLEDQNSNSTNSAAASETSSVGDLNKPESPADLLARLRSLREQVQMLPNRAD